MVSGILLKDAFVQLSINTCMTVKRSKTEEH